ncbi:hypothetical protein GCM10009554_46460 [Kribbella koreensis]|uniref:Uncharacterized protein n=1 Tax=Kribbella koreensis TaxID=57909 RepID=A0ABP4BB74_9ACTN
MAGTPNQDTKPGEAATDEIPNGAVLTDGDELERLVWEANGTTPVLLDCNADIWVLYFTEDGDPYACTLPIQGEPSTSHIVDLATVAGHGPLRVLWNGDPSHRALTSHTDATSVKGIQE